MSGIITSGLGRGAKFVSLKVYEDIFTKHLGAPPFHGTLNLEINQIDSEIIDDKFKSGIVYDNLIHNGKKMGGIILIPLKITCTTNNNSVDALGIRPILTSHDSGIIEIVACENLRKYWRLIDGCVVKIEFD